MWDILANIIPVIVRALRCITPNKKFYVKKIAIKLSILKYVLLGSLLNTVKGELHVQLYGEHP